MFQSRHKSLLVEEGRPLLGLVDYIHLNPVRAGITAVGQLILGRAIRSFSNRSWRANAFWLLWSFPIRSRGCANREALEFAQQSDPGMPDELARRYCQGWAIGSGRIPSGAEEKFCRAAGWGGAELQELREENGRGSSLRLVQAAGKSPDDARKTPKSAAWKIEAARALKAIQDGKQRLDSRPFRHGPPEPSMQLDPQAHLNYRTDPFFLSQDILADEGQEALRWWCKRAKLSRLQPDYTHSPTEKCDGIHLSFTCAFLAAKRAEAS